MKSLLLAGATLLLMCGTEAREPWGPPSACPKPKAECCPKPKCAPKCAPAPCAPKPCKEEPKCKPCPTQPWLPTQMCPSNDPCCPAWPEPLLNAGYSYPADIRTRCPTDVYVDVSFIYWHASEENLELGFINTDTAPFTTPFAANSPVSATSQAMDFGYKPGFKLGVGKKFEYDRWDLHAEYTWFHNTHDKSISVAAPHAGAEIFSTQDIPFSSTFPITIGSDFSGNVFNSASADWRLQMDIVDLDLGRWYYSGTRLTFHPTLGLRAAFIGQRYKVTYTNSANFGIGFADQESVTRKTHSWALGPKVGLDSNWNVGYGLRLFGNGEVDLLYTRYTTLSFKETHTATAPGGGAAVSGPVSIKDPSTGVLRTHIDLEIGLGWGMYFACNEYYWDLAAGYEFQTFFDQNMFRKFTDGVSWFTGVEPNGNLYIHGLTITTRLDF